MTHHAARLCETCTDRHHAGGDRSGRLEWSGTPVFSRAGAPPHMAGGDSLQREAGSLKPEATRAEATGTCASS